MEQSRFRQIFGTMICAAFLAPTGATGVLPVGTPEYDFVYERLERLEVVQRCWSDRQLGPYPLDLADDVLGPLSWLRSDAGKRLGLFGFAREDYRSAKRVAGQGLESFRSGLVAQPVKGLFIYGCLVLDEGRAKSPTYTGKKWRGLAGDVEQALAHIETGSLSVMVGRFASFWGQRQSLVLSPDVAMDGLAYSYRWGRLVLSYRLARLDGLTPGVDSVDQFENRYYAGHRLDVYMGSSWRIGLFETAIFGGPGRQIDLYYLNPLLLFHAVQVNEQADDNTFLGLDVSLKPGRGLKLYGQLLVDDFQVDDREQSDQEPNQYGLLLETYLTDVGYHFDLRMSYTRITNWTYNQAHPRNRYLYNGQPLSSARGNDFDLFEATLSRWFDARAKAGISYALYRQGEGRVTDEWTRPWLSTEGDYSEPFPTGIVQTTHTLAVDFSAFAGRHFFVDLEAGLDWVNNRHHVADDDQTLPYFQLRLSAFAASYFGID